MTPNTPDPVQKVRDLFLDFVDAACGDMSSLDAVAASTRTALRALSDDSLMLTASRAQQPELADEAIRLCAAIARLEPQRCAAWFAAGLALQLAKRPADAVAPYRRALAIDRTFPNLRNNLATALMQINSNGDEVAVLLEESVEADPDDVNAWINLGRLRADETSFERPLEASRRALALTPHSPLALNNYSMACKEAQRWDEAEQVARAACQYAPNDASIRMNLSMIRLVRGNYAEGWADHELRWQGSSELAAGRPVFPKPEWRGEPLASRTLLVWGEQGMGDLLQFSRYIPMLAERVRREGGRLLWNSFPQMGALLSRSMAGHYDQYTAGGPVEALPPFDYEISLVSLPGFFDTREETIPGPTRYLASEPAAAARWRERLAGETRLKVGLTWTGSLTHKRNPFRRVGLERYARHFGGIDNVVFYSLQPGASADIEAARQAGFEVIDYSAEWKNFDDTAAFIDALDLVISVCTSAAHLAGALGQKCWVLLDVNPHWVWLLDRRDSPWYPNTTLYRQQQFRQWEPVFDTLSADLAKLAAAHRAQQA
jgi:Flp pilus assembly protein TadD